ncbi:MAG: hypothetical protein PHI11_04300 [Gallionella sp.]|nr:hypothetical protein [Gallionella sp.]
MFKILALGLLWLSIQANAAQLIEKQGNVFIQADTGQVQQLTHLGQDSQPALSFDGKRIVFVRKQARSNPLIAEDQPNELWVMDATGGNARVLLSPHEDEDPYKNLTDFNHPLFSLDGAVVYFNCAAWVTSGAIHRVELSTQQTNFVTDGDSLDVVPAGKYQGYLIVYKHKYRKSGGANDAYWLVSPLGKEIRRIGTEEKHVTAFIRNSLSKGFVKREK